MPPAEPHAHAALVLAAGGSSRLGYAKQALRRDGKTLLRRTVRLALHTRPARCLVALGARAPDLAPLLDGLPAEIVHNPRWRDGMGSSLDCLRRALPEGPPVSHSLILGCDQPALDEAHLAALLAASRCTPDQAAVSTYGGTRGLPVVVPQGLWAAHPLQGDRGLRDMLAAARGQWVAVPRPDLAHDLDTPADVDAAVRRGWIGPPA
ncbi:nucleotidyltransferase family protein [Xylophilus sp.]|uniref:nucleotidyltransferase family protein n=1 Tax=Xylophilus sp. TaxID=2653893 RepID=UPI0013B9C99A|nr:nucleotidyltransferase family protein [Xylophilus sp.]KAF1048755.1 MAG: Molybdenum cofactor guanylyltransferase [Xylophilus sp.]